MSTHTADFPPSLHFAQQPERLRLAIFRLNKITPPGKA
jgi:hypothetical protein